MHDSRQYVFIKRSCPFPIHADGDVKGQKVPGYTMGDFWQFNLYTLVLVFQVFPGPLLRPVVHPELGSLWLLCHSVVG